MQRQTQLANDIWPLLLPRIQAMIAGTASVGGGTDDRVHFTGHAGDGLAHATLGAVEEDLEWHGVRPCGTRPS